MSDQAPLLSPGPPQDPQQGYNASAYPPQPGYGPPPQGYGPPYQPGPSEPPPAYGGPPKVPPAGAPQAYPGSYQGGAAPGPYTAPPGYQGGQQPTYMQPTTTVLVTQPAQNVVVVGGCPACRVGVLEDDFTCLGVCCAIFFFPLGILCCLAMRQRRCPNCGAIFG